jgi:nitroimidazol reductase NimA-like FMN-containing flavoprotein (pyridoxamine 5'-phosphate oxidase superfamily)
MHGLDDSPVRALGPLTQSECLRLLETHSLGRLAWQSADSQRVRPINYVFRSGAVYFRTSPKGILSELVRPADVALEVETSTITRGGMERDRLRSSKSGCRTSGA